MNSVFLEQEQFFFPYWKSVFKNKEPRKFLNRRQLTSYWALTKSLFIASL